MQYTESTKHKTDIHIENEHFSPVNRLIIKSIALIIMALASIVFPIIFSTNKWNYQYNLYLKIIIIIFSIGFILTFLDFFKDKHILKNYTKKYQNHIDN